MKIITIDGPSGSGKGTVGKLLAQKLHLHYLDSGIHYRILAYLSLQQPTLATEQLLHLFSASNFTIDYDQQELAVHLNGLDITKLIRTEECANQASNLATQPSVRQAILGLQRDYLREPGLVADGRDMGSVVFPGAMCSIYLHVSQEVAAKRRYLQLKKNNSDVTLAGVLQKMQIRDMRDTQRAAAPLVAPSGACHIQSDDLSIDEVVDKAISFIQESNS